MRSKIPSPSASRQWATTLGAAALLAALGAPAALASDCDLQVSHAPTGSQGDTAAVAITSQTLVAGVNGWERVGWQAAADTTITAVTLVRDEGTEHRTDGDLAEGMAEDVSELRFCATAGDTEAPPANEAEVVRVSATGEESAPEPAQKPAAEPTGELADDPVAVEEPEPTAPTDTTDDTDTSSQAAGTDEADAPVPAPAPTSSGSEHEIDVPQRGERGDETGTADADADADVEQAALAAAASEPGAPLAGGLVGALIGLIVIAGAQRRRTQEERR